MGNLWQDLRYAVRVLAKSPGFTVVAVLTLALGIGATTTIFSIVDTVVLKPLPFPTADHLVRIRSVNAATGHGGVAAYPDFLDWKARDHVFEGMAVFRTNDFTLVGPHEPLHLQGAVVSAQLFSLLGATPALGRSFLPQEDNPAATSGADPLILSYGLWQREFGSDVSVVGSSVQLGGLPFTVVGVMPPAFQYPIQAEPIELWTTIAVDARGGANAPTAQRGGQYLDVLGLLKPGVKPQQAQAELAGIASALNQEHPEHKPRTVQIVPEVDDIVGPLRTPLFVLLGAVICVLLIVCVNLANLLLARGSGRYKEMALRAALGASRRRAVRQLLTESIALGLLGGGLGLALAVTSLKSLVRFLPPIVPRLNAIGLDIRLLIFALLISLLAGILFGVAPALRVSRVSIADVLKQSGARSRSGGKEHTRLRDSLVVGEVALAMVLLLGAGLLVQSFLRLMRVDPGFSPGHVLTFQLDAPAGKQDAQMTAFFRDVVAKISALPGVSSASVVAALPLMGQGIATGFEVEGQPTPAGSRPSADFNEVEPNYFRTVGIELVAGRDFTEQDDASSTPVVMINRALARSIFPNQNPIGRYIRPGIGNGPGQPPMREIVGVIGDVKQGDIGAEFPPEMYVPLAQSHALGSHFIVIRTNSDPLSLVVPARRQVTSIDKNAPIYQVETLDQYFAQSLAAPRFVTVLLSSFSGLALLLACLGIYGVISYIVVQRTNEIGIRMALGARKGDVLQMVIAKGLKLVLAGLAIGNVVAFRLTSLLAILLYGVRPTDPLTFAGVSVILTCVALLACYIPACRAAKVDPMVALRYE